MQSVLVHGESAATPVSPRLLHAAQEFEAQMMKELMKPMTSTPTLTGSESEESSSVMNEFASEALAQAVSRQGGFGIARSIVHSISQSRPIPRVGKSEPTDHSKPSIRATQ
jgi:Rod binding protein